MKRNSNQPVLEIISIPSTSKEPAQIEKLSTQTTNIIPNILPLPSANIDGAVKIVQVSSLKSVSQDKIPNLIRLEAKPVTGLKLINLPKSGITQTGLEASTVKLLKPISNPGAQEVILGPYLEIKPQSTQNHGSITVTSVSSVPNFATIVTNKPPENLLTEIGSVPYILPRKTLQNTAKSTLGAQKKSIPLILQKKALLNLPKTPCIPDTDQIWNSTIEKPIQPKIKEHILQSSEKNFFEVKLPNEIKVSSLSQRKRKRERLMVNIVNNKSKRKNNKDRKTHTKDEVEENMYLADGFKEDVETFVEKCLQVHNLNFEKFTNIWKEMEFPCIFYGRQSNAELAELSEEVIHIAKAHMLGKNVSFEENVAGLFLVYALLNHQPFAGFAALRLTAGDVAPVLCLETEARRQKRHDVLYVLGHVLIKGPCQFHVLSREVSLEMPFRKYFDGTIQEPTAMVSVFSRNAECVPLFKELEALEQRYKAMRERLPENDKMSNLSEQPAAKLFELFRAHLPHARDADLSPDQLINDILSSKPEEDRSDLLKSIKEKAMATVVDRMKHLTGFEERQQDTSSSSSDSEIESRPTNRRLVARGKGRSSATNLQKLFGSDVEIETIFIPEPSNKEMPALGDTTSDLEQSNNNKGKETNARPKLKKHLEPKSNLIDSEKVTKCKPKNEPNFITLNNKSNNKRKRKNVINSPTAKRKRKTNKTNVPNLSDSNLDVIEINDVIQHEDINEVLANKDEFSKDKEKRLYVTEKMFDTFHLSLEQGTNNNMPSITTQVERGCESNNEDIEQICKNIDRTSKHNEKVQENVEMAAFDYKKTVKTYKKHKTDKKASKSNILSKDDTNNDTVSKNNTAKEESPIKASKTKRTAKIDKADLKKNMKTNDSNTNKNSPAKSTLNSNQSDHDIPNPNSFKSPTRRKTSTTDSNKSPRTQSPKRTNRSTPKSNRQSPRLKNQTSPVTEEINLTPRKRKNTENDKECDVSEFKNIKVKRGVKCRVKSSLNKLGLLEVADGGYSTDEVTSQRKNASSRSKSRLRNK